MSRRSKERLKQRRDVETQRRDVPEKGLIQRHNVETQHCDVPEKVFSNIATLRSNVATF